MFLQDCDDGGMATRKIPGEIEDKGSLYTLVLEEAAHISLARVSVVASILKPRQQETCPLIQRPQRR